MAISTRRVGCAPLLCVLFIISCASSKDMPEPECSKQQKLKLRAFESWHDYFKWRWTISPLCAAREPVHPCVLGPTGWACLPKLVVIGAQKGGTTGLRAKLVASNHFVTKKLSPLVPMEVHLWDTRISLYASKVATTYLAKYWADTAGQFDGQVRWNELVDKHGYAKKLTIDVTPSYLRVLLQHDVRRMLDVNPDAHFLVLARDPASALFSSIEMNVCMAKQCGVIGCDVKIRTYPDLAPQKSPLRRSCTPETIPCQGFWDEYAKVSRQIVKREDWHNDPTSGFKRFASGNDTTSYDQLGRWRYAPILQQQWLPVVPRGQMHIIQSDLLWLEPQKALDMIAERLNVAFHIKSVSGTAMKPIQQLKCACPSHSTPNLNSLKGIIERCNLEDAVACMHLKANEQFSELMRSEFHEWPESPILAWNRNLTTEACKNLGFPTDVPAWDTFGDTELRK